MKPLQGSKIVAEDLACDLKIKINPSDRRSYHRRVIGCIRIQIERDLQGTTELTASRIVLSWTMALTNPLGELGVAIRTHLTPVGRVHWEVGGS
jgi:hypothetical protein